nr:transketolase C-terminal domain-containing protein [Kibdelosporangium sp. MJ126-NF4]CEL12850.1 Pyruvate dehydrogenase E1 component beta subunit [Kibdelosporangium sp. MJ126-NF4]CTQ98536.1 Pyruvate dehydrogenase E1 component beta subunit (EC 1.2.4.1) [Kibdelosporangium sp. MJ126-NF4]
MSIEHPINTVLQQAMADQPDLTILCTYQDDSWVRDYGDDRIVRTPIAENAMMGMAVGMALTGRRVIVDVGRAAFLYSAMDPLVNQATKWRYLSGGQHSVPLLILGVTRHGENSGPQHEHAPHAMLSQIPGLVVAVPSSVNSAAGMIASALTHPDPVIILETSRLFFPGWQDVPDPEPTFDPVPFGVAKRIRDGQDVTLVGIGNTVPICLEAADALAERGYSCQVVDLRTAAPLDRAGVAAMASTTAGAVLVDETIGACSLVRDLGFHLATSGAVPPERIRTVLSAPTPVPASAVLQEVTLPGKDDVVAATVDLLEPALR